MPVTLSGLCRLGPPCTGELYIFPSLPLMVSVQHYELVLKHSVLFSLIWHPSSCRVEAPISWNARCLQCSYTSLVRPRNPILRAVLFLSLWAMSRTAQRKMPPITDENIESLPKGTMLYYTRNSPQSALDVAEMKDEAEWFLAVA